MAAAKSIPCNIPLIIRILGSHLYWSTDGSGIMNDRRLHQALDAGITPDDPSAVVESYFLPWWTEETQPDEGGSLSFENMEEALLHHRSITTQSLPLPPTLNKMKYTWPRHLSFEPTGVNITCKSCKLYHGVALGVMD